MPWRTAIGMGVLTLVLTVLFAGAGDRLFVQTDFDYRSQIWAYRVLVLVLPSVVGWITLRVCRELRDSELHPLVEQRGEPERDPSAAEPVGHSGFSSSS